MQIWPSRRLGFLFVFVVAIGSLSVGFQSRIQAEESANGRAAPSHPQEDALVVHEWGTFTTYSGSDGIFLDFRPLAAEHHDLPSFVRDRTFGTLRGLLSKARLRGKVRMETPVTYFYTDRVREVDVRVDFVNGLLTEFYPPVHGMSPPLDENAAFGAGEPLVLCQVLILG